MCPFSPSIPFAHLHDDHLERKALRLTFLSIQKRVPSEAFTHGLWPGTHQHFMCHWMSHCGTCLLELSHFPNLWGGSPRGEKQQHLLLRVTEAAQRHKSSSSMSRSKEQMWPGVGPVSPRSRETFWVPPHVRSSFPTPCPIHTSRGSPHALVSGVKVASTQGSINFWVYYLVSFFCKSALSFWKIQFPYSHSNFSSFIEHKQNLSNEKCYSISTY